MKKRKIRSRDKAVRGLSATKCILQWAVVPMLVGTLSTGAKANNGTMMPAYGAEAAGMAGVSIALPQDSVESANNPAGMAVLGNRIDYDVSWLRAPINTSVGPNHYYDTATVFIPEGGFTKVINDRWTWGVSVFGQGVALDYDAPVYGTRNTNSNLKQVVIAPTLTYKFAPGQYLGLSPRIAYQRLVIGGLEGVGFQTPGSDHSFGGGVAAGYLGTFGEHLSIGASYSSPIWFQTLDRYKTLIPDGQLNLPQQAGVGIAWHFTPTFVVGADLLWINWAGDKATGNNFANSGALGSSDGPGFGWRNQRVFRIGASYDVNSRWSVRAGASFANQLIPNSEATFGALAPLVPNTHYTVGATYRVNKKIDLTGSFIYAPKGSLHGNGLSSGVDVSASLSIIDLGITYHY